MSIIELEPSVQMVDEIVTIENYSEVEGHHLAEITIIEIMLSIKVVLYCEPSTSSSDLITSAAPPPCTQERAPPQYLDIEILGYCGMRY